MDYKTAKGWLRADERDELKRLASLLPQRCAIINIGVEYGASLVCLRAGAPLAVIIGIDIDMSKLDAGLKDEVLPILINRDSALAEAYHDAQVAVKWYEDGLQMVFVDGDHSRDGVLGDAALYCDLLPKGGYAVFHDCFDYDHPETGKPNPNSMGVHMGVDDWLVRATVHEWEELPRVGTMLIFRRL